MARDANVLSYASTTLLQSVDISICFVDKDGIFSRGEVKLWQEV